jgi:hypothetical protein
LLQIKFRVSQKISLQAEMVYVLQVEITTTYRILLRKAGKARVATMVDSPYHMYDQTRSSTEAGVQDVEDYNNSTSEW